MSSCPGRPARRGEHGATTAEYAVGTVGAAAIPIVLWTLRDWIQALAMQILLAAGELATTVPGTWSPGW